ncbi:MAG: Yip1 family protein [Chitinophagaceae bacterium]
MNLIERVKNILLTPKTEWGTIKTETVTPSGMFTGYVLPLALLPAAVAFLSGVLWIGTRYGIIMLFSALLSAAVGYFIGMYVTDALAPSFNSTKNLAKSAQLVGYSYTASAAASILGFIPGIGIIAALAGFVYSAYLMYLGVGPLKDTPEDKKVIYVVVIILAEFVIGIIIASIITASFLASNRIGMGY